jgi:hypothetical protein
MAIVGRASEPEPIAHRLFVRITLALEFGVTNIHVLQAQ